MEYIVTPERRAYLDARGYSILMACPGSGKTTSIVYKLKALCEEQEKSTKGYGGVACLSFTNAACDEYRKRFKELHGMSLVYPHIVSTIDSFVTQNIVLPFAHLIGIKGHIHIENDNEVLEELYHTHYIDSEGKEHAPFIPELRGYTAFLKKDRAKYEYDNDAYFWDGHKVTLPQEIEYAKTCILHRIKCGVLKSQDALWVAYRIICEHPCIAKALSCRYPYIIVDEAQDTSGLQMQILSKLTDNGLKNLEFVGDLAQSIYSWRNANPDILRELSLSDGYNVLHFTENRRSVQRIISFYELVKEHQIPVAVSTDIVDEGRDIIIYRYDNGSERYIVKKFNEKCDEYEMDSRLVLVRGRSDLNVLCGRRANLKLWKSSIPYYLIDAIELKGIGQFADAINLLRKAWCDCKYTSFQYKEKKEFLESILRDVDANAILMELLGELPSLELSFQDWEESTTDLLRRKLSLTDAPDFKQKKKIDGFVKAQLVQKHVNEYFGREEDAKSYDGQIMTIHNAKGASVDAVLLFLSKTHNNNTISFNDFPNRGQLIQKMTESQRLIYVACSRPKQFLAVAVPSSVSEEQIRRKIGRDIIIQSPNVQMSLF